MILHTEKGCYGTILIDLETSKPVDVLPSREGKELKKWLLKYPDVKIVTMDRASLYASAINEVCPGSEQVADRFHRLWHTNKTSQFLIVLIKLKIQKT